MERNVVIDQHDQGYYIVTIDLNNSQWVQDTDPIENGRIKTKERADLIAEWMCAQLDRRNDPLILLSEINQLKVENEALKQTIDFLLGV